MDPETRRIIEQLNRRIADLEGDLSRLPLRLGPSVANSEVFCKLESPLYSSMVNNGPSYATAIVCRDDGEPVDPEIEIKVIVDKPGGGPNLVFPGYGFSYAAEIIRVVRFDAEYYRPILPGRQTVKVLTTSVIALGDTENCTVYDGVASTDVQILCYNRDVALGDIPNAAPAYATIMKEIWDITGYNSDP